MPPTDISLANSGRNLYPPVCKLKIFMYICDCKF
jgi:hypothetical protein